MNLINNFKIALNSKKKEKEIRKSILVIDDDQFYSTILTMCLFDEYDVIIKNDGQEALNYLYNNNPRPDLIILDIEMPKMNGRVFLKLLRSSFGINKIPTIILSSNDDERIKSKMLKSGAMYYFNKPIERETLIEEIRSILGYEIAIS
jgi:DNA-binding response OmpR family regulator